MALDFPNNPNVDDTFLVGDTEYKWDGSKWKAQTIPLQVPILSGCTLTDNNITGNRFTSETFAVTATSTEEGNPASARDIKVQVTRAVVAEPTTTNVSAIGTVGYSSSFLSNSGLNDNTWRDIYWCGPPYNCYVAQGNGTSTSNFGTSTDGQTWTRHKATLGGSDWGVEGDFAYSPQDGRLYVVSSEVINGSGSRKAIMWRTTDTALANGGFEFERTTDPGMPSEGDHAHSGFGDLYWDEGTARWWAARTSSQNGRSAAFLRGPTGPSPVGTWEGILSFTGYELGRLMIHQDGSGTWSANGANQQGSVAGNKTWWLPTPASSTTSQVILGNGQDPVGRWAKIGTVGWICAANTTYSTGVGAFIATHLGDNPPNSGTPTMNNPITMFPTENITAVNLRDAIWLPGLNLGVLCGAMSSTTRTNHGCLITTSDCVNFNLIWTNQPGDNEEYRWDRMFWNEDRQELVMVAGVGTNPGTRSGYSKTVGESVSFPLLSFVSASGLQAFSSGQSIRQDTGGATGMVVGVDEANAQLIVQTSSGAWATGEPVKGESDSFTSGYLTVQSDGAVTGVSPSDPGWTRLNGLGPWTMTFPSVFADGQAPDTALPSGSGVQTTVRAISETNGFVGEDSAVSAEVIPTN